MLHNNIYECAIPIYLYLHSKGTKPHQVTPRDKSMQHRSNFQSLIPRKTPRTRTPTSPRIGPRSIPFFACLFLRKLNIFSNKTKQHEKWPIGKRPKHEKRFDRERSAFEWHFLILYISPAATTVSRFNRMHCICLFVLFGAHIAIGTGTCGGGFARRNGVRQ